MAQKGIFSKSSNPALGKFAQATTKVNYEATTGEVMTLDGTINKSLILTGILFITAILTWNIMSSNPGLAMTFAMGGFIGGLIVALIITFKPTMAPNLAWLYAALEGGALGGISFVFAEQFYGGIVLQAISLTMCTLGLMLMLYKYEIIKVTEKFKSIMMVALGAIFAVYMLSMVLGFFGISIPYLHQGGPIGIGISCVILVVAALTLLLDFDMIENGVKAGAPAYMEWFCGFALLMTLVWLYVEFLQLLAMLSSD